MRNTFIDILLGMLTGAIPVLLAMMGFYYSKLDSIDISLKEISSHMEQKV
jgi:hypothetical protein